MLQFLVSAYAIGAYLASCATLAYAIAFVADLPVPRTVDTGPLAPAPYAFALDWLLLAVFAIQHSVMARASFKQAWTRVVPGAVERARLAGATKARR